MINATNRNPTAAAIESTSKAISQASLPLPSLPRQPQSSIINVTKGEQASGVGRIRP